MGRTTKAIAAAVALSAALSAAPAFAALKVGDAAPSFTAQGALGGKPFTFSLDAALKKGPVVLYFFPSAFTSGCTKEAHDFAEATADYTAAGASVVGVTAGAVDRIAEFSSTECRNKFPVVADPGLKIAKPYKATLIFRPGWTDRTSYVIAPDHKIILAYSDLNPDQHVTKTLAAVKAYKASAK